jgi:DNA-binding CsgD family transcriptional regulator
MLAVELLSQDVSEVKPMKGSGRLALSKRQEEILLAASLGDSDKLIAEALKISIRTLEGHWRAIHRKLGSLNRCQAGFLFASLRATP